MGGKARGIEFLAFEAAQHGDDLLGEHHGGEPLHRKLTNVQQGRLRLLAYGRLLPSGCASGHIRGGHIPMTRQELNRLLRDESVGYWVKMCIEKMQTRDPVDVLKDCTLLVAVAELLVREAEGAL